MGLLGSAEMLKKHSTSLQIALLSSVGACTQEEINEKARDCNLSPEVLKELDGAAHDLVSGLRSLSEGAASAQLEELRLKPEVEILLRSLISLKNGDSSLPGKFLGMNWKIGVAAMSDQCKNLNSPFVTLQLKVEGASGYPCSHVMELTVPEFQKFASTMQDLHNIMSTF